MIEKHILNFKKYLKNQRGYSDHTINNYELDLFDFDSFLEIEDIGDVSEVDISTARFFVTYLTSQHSETVQYKRKTLARKISSVRSFYKFLMQEEVVETSPFTAVSINKIEKSLPEFLFDEQVAKMIASIDLSDELGIRNRLIVELLYGCGMRVSELCTLNIRDFNESNGLVLINGKGGKQRYVPYGKQVKLALRDYLMNSRNKLLAKSKVATSKLILNHRGTSLTERGVREILIRVSNQSGLIKKIYPHMLRHSFATTLINNGADLRSVQELLGHVNVETTGIYTHVTKSKLLEVYKNNHPRAIKK